MNPQDFNEQDWKFEVSSGFEGFINIKTNEWIYRWDYFKRKQIKESYHKWQDILLEYSLDQNDEDLIEFLVRNYYSPEKINKEDENQES